MELELLSGVRQNSESDKAVIACNDYLRMGPGRSLTKLAEKYSKTKRKLAPTQSLASMSNWSTRYGWVERSRDYDAGWELVKNEERRKVMEYGLAQDFERVNRLMNLAEFLEAQLYELSKPDPVTGEQTYHNVWVPDVKSIGSGEFAERVDLERFNAPLMSEFRATMDDIAKEVGGRIKKSEVSGADGKPITLKVEYEHKPPVD